MATIKGENLRVMVGDDLEHLQCIAAATNCVLHCALQVEEMLSVTTMKSIAQVQRTSTSYRWAASISSASHALLVHRANRTATLWLMSSS